MKTVILYDSIYGNTEKIAQAIGKSLGKTAKVIPVTKTKSFTFSDLDFLIVGSPVHGGRPTPAIDALLKNLPVDSLKKTRVAAFDTRFASEDHGLGIKILLSVIRYAAERMANELVKKGGKLAIKPAGFIVKNKEGPLKKGELERARNWAHQLFKNYDMKQLS
jgi:flavodoxin